MRHGLELRHVRGVEQKAQAPITLLRERGAQRLTSIPNARLQRRAKAGAKMRPIAKRSGEQIVQVPCRRRHRWLAVFENRFEARLLLERIDEPHGRGRMLSL